MKKLVVILCLLFSGKSAFALAPLMCKYADIEPTLSGNSFIQQVPMGTDRTFRSGDLAYGSINTFSIAENLYFYKGVDYTKPGAQNRDIVLSVSYVPVRGVDPGNDVNCTIGVGGVLAAPSTYNPYMQAGWAQPGSIPSAYLGRIQQFTTSNVCSSASPGAWINHPVAGVWIEWIPLQTTKPVISTNYNVFVRFDVDFPEYGVTNRYFMANTVGLGDPGCPTFP